MGKRFVPRQNDIWIGVTIKSGIEIGHRPYTELRPNTEVMENSLCHGSRTDAPRWRCGNGQDRIHRHPLRGVNPARTQDNSANPGNSFGIPAAANRALTSELAFLPKSPNVRITLPNHENGLQSRLTPFQMIASQDVPLTARNIFKSSAMTLFHSLYGQQFYLDRER